MQNLTKEEIYEVCACLEDEISMEEIFSYEHSYACTPVSCAQKLHKKRYDKLCALHNKLIAMLPQEETDVAEE